MSTAPHPSIQKAARVTWAAMARGEKVFGAVRRRERGAGWRIDVRPYGFIYSVGGAPLESKKLADAVLDQINMSLARNGNNYDAALEPWLPATAKRAPVLGRYQDWLATKDRQVKNGDRSPNTVREYRRYAREGGELDFWEGRGVYEIDAASLEDWDNWLADRELSAKTRRNVLGAFRSFCSWLVRRGVLDRPPLFPTVPTTDHKPVTLSDSEQSAVLEAIPEPRRGLFLGLALLGLRPGEARALDVSDLYHEDGELWVRVGRAIQGLSADAPIGPTKTRRQRSLPVPVELGSWIEAHVERSGRLKGRPLFEHPRGGRWSHGAVRDTWKRACEAVGVDVGLYEGTKHTAATKWLRQGADERTIQEILGHSDVRSTRKYAQLEKRAVVRVLRS